MARYRSTEKSGTHHTLTQDVHDGTDVEELHPAARRTKVHQLQSRPARRRRLTRGITDVWPPRQGTDEVLDELVRRVRSDMLRDVGTAVHQHTGDLGPVGGHRMTTRDQLEAAVGEREPLPALDGHDPDTTR